MRCRIFLPARPAFWTIAPAAVLPIFTAGQVRAGVRLSEAQKREMLITYQKTIYNGIPGSVGRIGSLRPTRASSASSRITWCVHLAETARLSNLRYQGGLDSYLQVLDAERNLFQGRLGTGTTAVAGTASYVQIYRALGGGWQ